jgi:hypothetical protein
LSSLAPAATPTVPTRLAVVVAVLGALVVACGSSEERSGPRVDASVATARVEAVAHEVDAWADAPNLRQARAHAEAAANLIVGPGGLGYGDRDGNGTVAGAVTEGLLPSRDGSSDGVVLDTVGDAACVHQDVLGGGWEHPRARWALLTEAIREWSPDNNTFPDLPAHPMRIVGWATLAQAGSYDEAIGYSGHADVHVDASRDALADC